MRRLLRQWSRASCFAAALLLAACSGSTSRGAAPGGSAAPATSAASSSAGARPAATATAAARLGTAAPATRAAAQSPAARWTVLIYMAANNDLEIASLLNLQQLADAASSPLVNVVVQITRDPDSDITDTIANLKPFTSTKRLLVQHGRFTELADLGRVNSGSPATLADFISWGERSYPAQHYLLALSDHGGGWQGCCEDDTFKTFKTFMDLASIQRALKQANAPLDIIGFDACLMASVEVAAAVQPYASLLVASEELEPAYGWDYTALVNTLARTPDIGATDLARAIADTYLAGLNEKVPDEALYTTFSVVDLAQLPAVHTSTTRFLRAVSQYVNDGTQANRPERLARIGQVFLQAEAKTPAFGTEGPGDLGVTLDLGTLAHNAATESGAPTLQQAAVELRQTLSAAVIYAVAGKGYAGTSLSGLSIATLADGESHQQDLKQYGGAAFAAPAGWLDLVKEFDAAVAAASDLDLEATIARLQASARRIAPGQTLTVSGQVRDDLLVTDVRLSVATTLDGRYVQLSQDSREKHLGKQVDFNYNFDGRAWYMSDGNVSEPVYTQDWRPGQRVVYGLYRQRPSDDGDEAYLLIDEASGRILQIFDIDGGLGMLGAVIPGVRSTFTPYVFDGDDEVTEIPLKPEILKTARFTRMPLAAGQYDIVVDGENLSGNVETQKVSIAVTGP
jgi:hypothetical protein